MDVNCILNCDVMDGMKLLDDKSIDACITSPPYWQLRDYNFDGQWGLEKTFTEYLEHLWGFMDELYRVLKDDGTAWINLGDTYSGSNGFGTKQTVANENQSTNGVEGNRNYRKETGRIDTVEAKCLLLIPHRFAIGCIDRHWIVRNDCVWAKRNGMPESVTDRFSKKHEYIFLMVKKTDYYFDLDGIRDKHKAESVERYKYSFSGNPDALDRIQAGRPSGIKFGGKKGDGNPTGIYSGNEWTPREDGKNPGDVSDFWDITTKGSSDEHYASYNSELIDKPIIAGCKEGGIILDPFCGTATTGIRALQLNRKFIGFEGSKKYFDAANKKFKLHLSQQKLF